jgi:DNA polymerase elongation subunit (family B)
MSLNISPETKIGKIDNWDAEEYIKNKEKEYIVDGETVSKELVEKFFKAYNYSIASNGVLYKTDEKGVIPSILDEWFDKRVEYKDLMKKYGKEGDSQKYVFYKQRQLVQKILLNSLYGVLGLPAFRFYDIDNAEAVTLTGQTVIKKTADILNLKYNKEIGTENIDYNIYIDTDSCFFSALPLVKHRFPEIDVNDDEAMTEKIYDIANESQEFINSFYDIFSKRFFNIDHHRFEIKQEMIAKSGMWVAKKRYAQWIIADNGVRVDKLDVKGLDVVRSSFPKAFQKFMSNLLISILKGASKDEVDTLILEMKKNVHNIDIVDLAKNSSLNNLIKYRGAIDIGVINSFNKGTPAQVKGAIAYNRLLTHYKCPYKFLPFKDGDKLKWIYLKDNPFGIETLAFRGDSDPKEIKKFITTYVDRDYMFTSELDNKLQDFYSALKWQMPSASSKIINEFFDF